MNKLVTIVALAVGGMLLSRQMKKSSASQAMSSTSESIAIDVPVRTAYNQWTQFEDFPQFMESVQEVRQVNDIHLHWRATVAGKEEQWDAEITEQIPDKRIAWRSTSGVKNAGVVTFHKLADDKTRIMLQMDYSPESVDEKIGNAIGLVKLQVKDNLERYKKLLESRGSETGAWHGVVAQK